MADHSIRGRAFKVARIAFPAVALVAVAAWIAPAFLTIDNVIQVLRQVSIIGLISLGVSFVVLCGRLDLSVGSLLSLSGVVLISLHESVGPEAAIATCLLIGLLVGATNGILIAVLGLDSLITTLGMLSVLQGLTLMYTGGKNELVMNPEATWFAFIGRGYIYGIPFPVLLLIALAVCLYILLSRTVFGRQVMAVGGNETASMFSGIRARRTVFFAYLISGFMTAVAAIVFGSRVMAVQNNSGSGMEITVLAAIILGGTSLSGGSGGVARSLVGVVALGFLQNWLLLIGLPYYAQWIVTWAIIVGAVWANQAIKRERVFA